MKVLSVRLDGNVYKKNTQTIKKFVIAAKKSFLRETFNANIFRNQYATKL